MATKPILENEFYHDGRGPELQAVIWKEMGVIPIGFEYFNPDDGCEEQDIKHIVLEGVQAYAMASEEVHANILMANKSKAAIVEVTNSTWLQSFSQTHLEKCKHYQVMFYDEVYDIVCEEVIPGRGRIRA